MTTKTETTHALACPLCGCGVIRTNLMGDMLYRTGIDPLTGQIKLGSEVGFTPSDGPVPLYVCGGCSYQNVVPSMFVREVA
jgi:hypothetical protein